MIKNLLEIRGIGIVDVDIFRSFGSERLEKINLVVDLWTGMKD